MSIHRIKAHNFLTALFLGKRKLKSYDVVDEALTFFKQYMAENNIDLVTFFQDMDEDGSMAVSYDEFREGLKVCHLTYGCY